MNEKIKKILSEAELYKVDTLQDLEDFRIKYLSKKGILSSLFDDFRNIPLDQKKAVG